MTTMSIRKIVQLFCDANHVDLQQKKNLVFALTRGGERERKGIWIQIIPLPIEKVNSSSGAYSWGREDYAVHRKVPSRSNGNFCTKSWVRSLENSKTNFNFTFELTSVTRKCNQLKHSDDTDIDENVPFFFY